MGRRLAAAVHVRHPKSNEWLILQPGDEPDEDLAEVITNPDAWEQVEGDAEETGGDEGDGQASPDPDPQPDPDPEPEPEPEPEQPAKPVRARSTRKADEQ